MPYTDGKHSLGKHSLAKLQVSISKLQVSISEIKQYFHNDIYERQPLAVACRCSVGRLAVARRGGGVHHGDGDGQAVVQEKGAALAAPPAGRSTRKSRRASWPGARRAWRCSRKATVSNGSLKSCRTCESGGRSRGGGSSTGCSTGGGSGRACAGLSGELRCRMSAMERPVSRVSGVSGVSRGVGGVGGVGGVECRECRECRNALTLLDTTRTSPLSRWLDTRWTLVSECRAECRSSVD